MQAVRTHESGAYMSATNRVSRVCGLLIRDTPYRPNKRQVRRVLAALPNPSHPLARRSIESFVAAVVALPFQVQPVSPSRHFDAE
jgi:hypothetical protein